MTDEEAALHAAQQVGHLYLFLRIVAYIGIGIALMSLFGSVTSRQALKRGHLPRKWFWIGFFLPVVGLVILFLLRPGVAAQASRRTRPQELVKLAFIVGAAVVSAAIAWTTAGWKWGVFWGVVAGIAAVPGELGVSWFRVLTEPQIGTPEEQQRARRGAAARLALVVGAVGAALALGLWLSNWTWAVLWAAVAGIAALEFAATGVHKERVWGDLSPEEQRRVLRSRLLKTAVVVVSDAIGFVIGLRAVSWRWGITWGVVGAIVGIVGIMLASILFDQGDTGAPRTTPSEDRPPEPRRVITLVWPLAIMFILFWIGGLFGDALNGVVWGAIAAAGAVAALFVAKERPDVVDMGALAAGLIASTVLTNLVLPDIPEKLTANLSLQMAAAWIPAGIGAAVVLWRRTHLPSKVLTSMVGWFGAGLLALPAAVAFELLKPLESWVGEPDPFSTNVYAFIGVTAALIGGAFLLSGLTGLMSLSAGTTVFYMSAYAGAQVGFTIPGLIENFTNLSEIAKKMWPPDFEWAIGTGTWWNLTSWDFGSAVRANPLIETFRIAIIACLIGVTVAVPLALRASRITAIRGSDYWLNKGIMNTVRTVPDLFWAMIFATSVGTGPFAGTLALIFFSMAIMAKLLSETVDAVDPRPIEAARATGSHHWPAMRMSVWPQVLPNYVAYALYIFEINIRASVVLGIVGAGGIGRVLEAQRSFFQFDRVLAIVLVIFVAVFLIEQVSVALRRRLV